MGGAYWKLGRIPRERYLEIEAELRAFMDKQFGHDNYRIPRCYGSKKDFGDVDILLSSRLIGDRRDWEPIKKAIVEGLAVEKCGSIDGGVFSIVYNDFQVDFFRESHGTMVNKSNFMDFNDLGNLIGRLFRPMGLKYGENGLEYVYRRKEGSYKKEILLSTDWQKILTFGGLDYTAWELGFHEIEEMFEWLMASPYFRSDPYTNPTSKVIKNGSKQRPTIQRFIQYIKEQKVRRDPHFLGKEDYIGMIDEAFPGVNLKQMIEDERRKEEEATKVYTKFNGKLAMEWVPHLEGKDLGNVMRQFNQSHTRSELLEMEPDEIQRRFISLSQEMQQK